MFRDEKREMFFPPAINSQAKLPGMAKKRKKQKKEKKKKHSTTPHGFQWIA